MKGLMLKDLYTYGNFKNSLLVQLVIVVAFSFMNQSMSTLVTVMMLVVSTTLLLSTFSYDESANWDRYAVALPVKRGTVVAAKYLMSLLSLLAMAAAAFGISILLPAVLGREMDAATTLASLAAVICLCLVSLAVSLPVAFRLGAEKARLAGTGASLLFFGMIMLVIFLFRNQMDGIDGRIVLLVGGLVMMICFGLFAGSFFLSRRFYDRREF